LWPAASLGSLAYSPRCVGNIAGKRGVPRANTREDDAMAKSKAGLTITLTRPQLLALLSGNVPDGLTDDGDPKLLGKLFSYVTKPDVTFPIVTP